MYVERREQGLLAVTFRRCCLSCVLLECAHVTKDAINEVEIKVRNELEIIVK